MDFAIFAERPRNQDGAPNLSLLTWSSTNRDLFLENALRISPASTAAAHAAPARQFRPCLVLIFNHRYEANLPVLRKIYGDRFSKLLFLMPFSRSREPDVIGVAGNSYEFNLFVSQAAETLSRQDCSHFVFAGDDLLLNPILDETNLLEALELGPEDGHIRRLRTIHDYGEWVHSLNGFYAMRNTAGVEWQDILPNFDDACTRLRRHGIDLGDLVVRSETKRDCWKLAHHLAHHYCRQFPYDDHPEQLVYPLVGSYSDFFVLPKGSLEEFALYSGVFAACRLFAEIAIPTALALAVDSIKTLTGPKFSQGLPIWQGMDEIGSRCGHSIQALFAEHRDRLYIHPVKLSRWKWDAHERN